jgi:hypothetical protein
MSSEETEAASPPGGSHPHGAKGLWALGGLTVSTVLGHRIDHKPYAKRWVEAMVKPREEGAPELYPNISSKTTSFTPARTTLGSPVWLFL